MKKLPIILFVIAIALIATVVFIVTFAYAIRSGETGGAFGDTFGVATSFFSMLTLGFLVTAVVLQREEVKLVRDERDQTRQLLSEQQGITAKQREILQKQSFEQSFFTLLSLIMEEKARLLKLIPEPHRGKTELDVISENSETLLINFAIGANFPPEKKLFLDQSADRAFNLVNLMSSALALIESDSNEVIDRKYYISMLQGLVDYPISVCFAWFHGCTHGQSPSIARAYDALSVHFSISPALRDAMASLISKSKQN